MFCTECGATVEDGTPFCTSCGAPLGDAPAGGSTSGFCTECGATLEEGTPFCTNCGAPTGAPAPSEQTPPPPPLLQYQAAPTPQPAPMPQPAPYVQQAPAQKSSAAPVVIVIVVVLILVAAAVALFILQPWAGDSDGVQETTSSQEASTSSSATSLIPGGIPGQSQADRQQGSNGTVPADNMNSRLLQQDYVLPYSDSREYTLTELSTLSNFELYVARNEIYARHGRMFQNQDLRDHFAGKRWYYASVPATDFDRLVTLNSAEKANANLILGLEQERKSPYVP